MTTSTSQNPAAKPGRPQTVPGFYLPWLGGSPSVRWAAFGIAYAVALLASVLVRPAMAIHSPLGLPAGLLVAALMASPKRCWAPFVVLAAAIHSVVELHVGESMAYAVLESVGLAVEALVAALLGGLWLRNRRREIGGVIGLLALVALPGPALGTGIMASASLLSANASEFFSTWLGLWCRDALGILIMVPLAMGSAQDWREWWAVVRVQRRTEAVLLLAIAIADAWIVFGLLGHVGVQVKFLLVPVFTWVALRFHPRGVAFAGALLTFMLFALGTAIPHRVDALTPDVVLVLQVFFVVCLAMALMIAVAWTEYETSAGRLLRLRNRMAEILVVLDVVRGTDGRIVDFRVRDVNPAFTTVTGRPREQAEGALLSEILPNPAATYGQAVEEMLEDGEPRRFELHSTKTGRHFQVSAYVTGVKDRIATLSTDISPAKQREVEVLRFSRMYSVVSQVNQRIVRSATREELLDNVCHALIEQGECAAAWAGRYRRSEDRLVKVASAGCHAMFEELGRCGLAAEEALARRAFDDGRTVVCEHPGADPAARPWGPIVATHGIQSVASFPLREEGRLIGAVCVYAKAPGAFPPRDLELLDTVSRDLGFALDKLCGEQAHAQAMANLVESDRRFRGLFEQAPVAYQALDPRGVIVDVNPAWLALFGASRAESIGRPFLDFLSDEARPVFVRGFSELVSKGGQESFDLDLVKEYGDSFASQVVIRVQGDGQGRMQVAHCVIHDIDERVRYERGLREGEERIELAFEIANDGIWEANLRTGMLSFSHRFYTMLGYEPGEFDETPREWMDRVHPEDAARIVERYPAFLASDEASFELEYRIRDKSGGWRWIVSKGRVVEKGPSGEKVRILGTNSDITARKRSELALRQSERRLSLVIEGSALAAWDWDVNTGEILFNAYWSRLMGAGDTERLLAAQEWRSLIHPQDLESFDAAFQGHLHGSKPYFECEYRVCHRDGSWLWVYDRGQVIARDGGGGPLRAVGTLRDITDRRLAEQQVREQAALLGQTHDIVLTTNADGFVRSANHSAETFFSLSSAELLGRHVGQLFDGVEPACDAEFLGRVFAEREWGGELAYAKGFLQGRVLESRWSVVRSETDEPDLVLVVCTDITDRRLLESRFLRAQRMESIGSLASGVAHDLNNIFLPISLAAHILKKDPPDDQRASLYAMLDQSAQRGAELVQQLLTFGRGLDGRRVELQPRMLFHEIRRIIRETFPKNIALESRVPDDLWTVSADPTQLHQVLLNLCLNARDAMAVGGTLSLAAENVVFDEHYAAMNPEAEPGPFVILEVADTGIGIPPENLEKIFDPFFTTKEPGVGTGLGLSTVHGIVKGHGGFVQVQSQPGEGTVFKVYLPAIPSPREVDEVPPSEDIPTGEGETILVVDDEEAVRETLRHMLENHGYRVILAPDGRQGLVCYNQQRHHIRALVTDVMMPVMDGMDLMRALRKQDSSLPMIAMSGLPEKEIATAAADTRADAFIMKPFVSEQMLIVLNSVLAPGRERPLKESTPARP